MEVTIVVLSDTNISMHVREWTRQLASAAVMPTVRLVASRRVESCSDNDQTRHPVFTAAWCAQWKRAGVCCRIKSDAPLAGEEFWDDTSSSRKSCKKNAARSYRWICFQQTVLPRMAAHMSPMSGVSVSRSHFQPTGVAFVCLRDTSGGAFHEIHQLKRANESHSFEALERARATIAGEYDLMLFFSTQKLDEHDFGWLEKCAIIGASHWDAYYGPFVRGVALSRKLTLLQGNGVINTARLDTGSIHTSSLQSLRKSLSRWPFILWVLVGVVGTY